MKVDNELVILSGLGEAVAFITLNRPEQKNCLDKHTIHRLNELQRQLEEDKAVQVVVIRGAGGTFSAGGDLKGYIDLYKQPEAFRTFLSEFHQLLDSIEASKKIYVAIIDGYCAAGGLELLLACDVVIAAQSAKIGDAHVNFGQLPGAGGSQRLPRTVGLMKARYLMFTGEFIDAIEAERIGLVSKVIADPDLEAFINKLLSRLSSMSPLGMAGMKHLVNQGLKTDIASGLSMELDFVHHYATTSRDATEGLIAFHEKRKPRFI